MRRYYAFDIASRQLASAATKGRPEMSADFILFIGLIVGSLAFLDVLVSRLGVDSRPIDAVRWL